MHIGECSRISLGMRGYLSWAVIDLNGRIKSYSKIRVPNMIVDSGRNFIGQNYIADAFRWCRVGTGTSNTTRSTIALDSEENSTNTYSEGENGYLLQNPSIIMFRTFEFEQAESPTTYTEVGFSPNQTGDLFSRILLDDPINVEIGDSVFIRYDLVINLDPSEPLPISNPIPCVTGEGGILQFQLFALNIPDLDGQTISSNLAQDCNEPSTECDGFVSNTSDNPATLFNSVDRSYGNSMSFEIYLEPYANNSFKRRKILSFNVGQANGTWRSVGLGNTEQQGVIFVFNNDFIKDSTNASFIFEYSWDDTESYDFKTLAYWAEDPDFFFQNPILEYLMNDYRY